MPDTPKSMNSLLDEQTSPGPGVVRPRRGWVARSRDLQDRLRERAGALWARRLTRHIFMGASSVAAVALGLAIYFAIRPVPKPDYESADLSRLFDYTLLTDEFNALPVEERIKLVSQLYDRVRVMDANESAMMAAFFAGIAGEARGQLEKNAGKLMIDATDLVAKDYAAVPPEARESYLDDAYVRLVRLTAPFDGSLENKTDEEIIARGKRDAARNKEAMDSGEVSARQASRMLTFMNRQVEQSASPSQQQRLTLFMRDLSRHLRGDKIGG